MAPRLQPGQLVRVRTAHTLLIDPVAWELVQGMRGEGHIARAVKLGVTEHLEEWLAEPFGPHSLDPDGKPWPSLGKVLRTH